MSVKICKTEMSWLAACSVQVVPCGRSTEQMSNTGVTVEVL